MKATSQARLSPAYAGLNNATFNGAKSGDDAVSPGTAPAPFRIEPLPNRVSHADVAGLAALLRDAVEGGASVGYLTPVSDAELLEFWRGVLADARAGRRAVLVVRDGRQIVGTVQLELAEKPNSRHRAELQKLLVLRSHRGRRLGCALIGAAEHLARQRGRSLIVLDTSSTGNAVGLYARCGYTRGGLIPRYARDPDGAMIDTIIYYKELSPTPGNGRREGVFELRPA